MATLYGNALVSLYLPEKTMKIGRVLTLLQAHWPTIVPYMGIHWADFYCLLGIVSHSAILLSCFQLFF